MKNPNTIVASPDIEQPRGQSVSVSPISRRRIMIVTDEPMSRALIEAILRAESDFEVLMSSDAMEMQRALGGVDLIVLDLSIGSSDLLNICSDIKSHAKSWSVPLLLLTSSSGGTSVDRSRALEAGADDVVGKPFHRAELILRIRSLLRLKLLGDEVAEVESILLALARSLEAKMSYTQAHSERVAGYASMIGRATGLSRDDLRILRRAALIHDVGKVAVPDMILNKPGILNSDESRLLRQQSIFPEPSANSINNQIITPMIRHQHERFDGSGYPDGLSGDQIPLGARILALADAYDAMVSQRPYRSALSADRARFQLRSGAGSQWDPKLIEVFLTALDQEGESGMSNAELNAELA